MFAFSLTKYAELFTNYGTRSVARCRAEMKSPQEINGIVFHFL